MFSILPIKLLEIRIVWKNSNNSPNKQSILKTDYVWAIFDETDRVFRSYYNFLPGYMYQTTVSFGTPRGYSLLIISLVSNNDWFS